MRSIDFRWLVRCVQVFLSMHKELLTVMLWGGGFGVSEGDVHLLHLFIVNRVSVQPQT